MSGPMERDSLESAIAQYWLLVSERVSGSMREQLSDGADAQIYESSFAVGRFRQ
jgi:hypothetical protein